MDSNLNSKEEKEPSKEDFEKLYKYFKSVLKKNKTLSIAFMGITLTAFIFLLSLGYPDVLDDVLIIGGITIKVVSSSLSILVLSFFLFLLTTFLYHYCELRLDKLYLYWKPKHNLSIRYEKSEQLYDGYYKFAYFLLFSGVAFLITAVTFIFLNFSAGGIIIALISLPYFVILIVVKYLISR
jgi:hypothetical protein